MSIDLGLGEALYASVAVPLAGETHPHSLGFYRRAGELLPERLAAFEPTRPEHWRVRPRAATTLRIERHYFECEAGRRDAGLPLPAGPLTRWTWCVSCGVLHEDRRVALGHEVSASYRHGWWAALDSIEGGVALYCADCRRSRARDVAASIACAAPGCRATFAPADRRSVTCSNACRKRLNDWRRAHDAARAASQANTGGARPGYGLPCIRGAFPHECWCWDCHTERERAGQCSCDECWVERDQAAA